MVILPAISRCRLATGDYASGVNASEIIHEIRQLSPLEQERVRDFLVAGTKDKATPQELVAIADRMVNSADTAEADVLERQLLIAFYGR